MEITKDFLKERNKEYLTTAESFREQYIANTGAAQAITRLIADMAMEVVDEKDVKIEGVVEDVTQDTPK